MVQRTVVISGAFGLIGTGLSQHLVSRGFAVRKLVRRAERAADELFWDPVRGQVDASQLEGTYALIHLAGEPVGGRWSDKKKRAIMDSRVQGTRTLAAAISSLESPPKVWLSASAIGYYGDRGGEELSEESLPGRDYLSQVCQAWEAETTPAGSVCRVVKARIGLVLTREGGALSQMLTPFKLGVGGRLGSGSQYMSWITLHDTLRAFEHCLEPGSPAGPVNFTAPLPVTNAEFTRTLGRVLGRPTALPVPKFALKFGFGEFADGILASQRVVPRALLDSGFEFEHAELGTALRAVLGE